MNRFRKWFHKPKKSDQQLLAQFYCADEELRQVAAKLNSLNGKNEPQRCALLVSQFRSCQDNVLSILNQIMNECIPGERANRDFYVKFPDEIQQENLEGQLWFGAECLAAGSIIMNQEAESEAMRPLAKELTRCIDEVRNIARDQALRNRNIYTELLCQALRKFDNLFAGFEFSYVSAMVPVKSFKQYDIQQDVTVLFCETVSRALKRGYITQDLIDDYEPALMFTIPRLAIVCGLMVFPDGPMKLDGELEDMSELFRPFHSLLKKIRNLLRTLKEEELHSLERNLCVTHEEGLVARRCSSAIPHSAITLAQQLEHTMHGKQGAKSQSSVPPQACVVMEEDKEDNPSLLQVEPGRLEWDPEVELSSSLQTDIMEMELLSMMFYQAGDEMSSFLSPAPSQTSSPYPQRRGAASLTPSPMASPLRLRRAGSRVSSGGWSSGGSSVDKEERVFYMDDLDGTQKQGYSLPNSPYLNMRRNMSCPSSPWTSLSRKCAEAALQRSKNWPSSSRLSIPDPGVLSVPPICLNGEGLSQNVSQDLLETAELIALRMKGVKLSATVINPLSPNLSTWTEKVKEEKDDDEDDDEEDSQLQSLNEGATYCQISPCICLQCPSLHIFPPDHDTYGCLTPQTQGPPLSAVRSPALSPREQGKERSHVLGPRFSSLRAKGQQRDGVPASVACPSLTQWRTNGDGKAEQRVVEAEPEDYTLSQFSYQPSSNNTEGIEHPDIQLACHNIRSRFNSSGDLLHRLFVCISGVADQLQSNYSSDLRTILKTLFQIMTTKTVLAEEDKQRKASLGLSNKALEDCALCMEWLSSSPSMEQDVQCEALPNWVPDEACSVCTACNAPFTLIRKKHHCRSCGKIFCSRCSARSAPLPRYGQVKAVRVCTHCYMFHVTPFCPWNSN
ncbi:lateral signaling target protein 2 homolog [Oncorhynchus clarkii lewisi]|uniref:lateral signaling target protein 2 homolog n=1 Tax=Oncorhynchus clarkii lewisi TaxID=490388 RepID=UPI0039B97C77